MWLPENRKQHKWLAFCLCRGHSRSSLLLNALSLGESLNSQKWLLLFPGNFLGDVCGITHSVFLGGYAESEAMSPRWAEQGLAWPPAAYRGLRSRGASQGLRKLYSEHQCSMVVSVGFLPFFFFLTFNREVLSRHTLVLISALMKPAQAVFPWHLPEILWGQLHSLPLIILTIFRANCQGTYSIPSFYVFNSFSLPISIYIEVFFFFKEIPSSFYQW